MRTRTPSLTLLAALGAAASIAAHAAPPADGWHACGAIYASVDLQAGDTVRTRVFDASGERPELSSRLQIHEPAHGQRGQWPQLLAARVNAERHGLLRLAPAPADDDRPAGSMQVSAAPNSGLVRVEIDVQKAVPDPLADVQVSGVRSDAHRGEVEVGLTAVGNLNATVSVFDAQGRLRGQANAALDAGGRVLRVPLQGGSSGMHQVVVTATVRGHEALIQKTQPIWIAAAGRP